MPMTPPAVALRVFDAPLDAEQTEAVVSVLREHNRVHNAGYWDAIHRPGSEPKPLHVLATDEHGRTVGGLTGTTQLKWFRMEVLAVCEGARRQGVGRRIVEAAERAAVDRGCRHAFADTMEHQAPEFFQHLGYVVVGRLEDWDSHGQTKLLLVKNLVPPIPG
jgi:GNAT superfamily N-acetyltransferase